MFVCEVRSDTRRDGMEWSQLAQSARLQRCRGMDDRLGAARARGRRPAYGDPGADRRFRETQMTEFDVPPEFGATRAADPARA